MRYQYGESRGRLSPLLFLSALAVVVGVLGGCGSSDSGQDVQPEPEAAAAGSSRCPTKSDARALAARGVDWNDCDRVTCLVLRRGVALAAAVGLIADRIVISAPTGPGLGRG